MRIGVVSFVNSKPYALGLEAVRSRHHGAYSLHYAPPRALSRRLEAGELDMALIPAFDYLCGTGAGFVPGHGIASAGEVDTVRLFFAAAHRPTNSYLPPLTRIRTDNRSASSVALLRVLLAEYFKQDIPVESDDVIEHGALAEDEGLLVIGDAAHQQRERHTSLDLGGIWTAWTGLPFVYALWVGNGMDILEATRPLLDEALDWAEAHSAEVIEASVAASGFDAEWLRQYQNEKLIYRLGAAEEAGLERFADLCRRLPGLGITRTATIAGRS